MRKIILTESQAKLLLEEIDKNDTIQKLIFCEPSDIEFEVASAVPNGVSVGRGIFQVIPVIDGKEVGTRYVSFLAEEVNVNGENWYQLHIRINEDLRRMGIAYKLYMAFILQDYPVCSLFKNRAGTFYSENDASIPSDSAIGGLWNKIASNPSVQVDDLYDRSGNKIGIKAWHKRK